MTSFARHAALLFLAMRAGDLVNLAAGMWLVPKFIAPEALGAVLPVTTVATLLTLPVFAFGMAVMKESADLAGRNERGRLASLWRGVFGAIGLLTVLSLALSAVLLPRYLGRTLHCSTSNLQPLTSFIVIAAATLGSVAPVYTDALQAVKRFRALGAIEIAAALARFATLMILMPLRAFAGYFVGNAMQPLVRIAASVFTLRHNLAVRAERWWTRENTKRFFVRFALILLYIAVPMVVAGIEQDLVREQLPVADSAAYFIVTRLSDLMNYLTFPLLIVLFPYAAEAAREKVKVKGEGEQWKDKNSFVHLFSSPSPELCLVMKCSAVTLFAATLLGIVYALWGRPILALIPNGANYSGYLVHLPTLLAIVALTACQTFYTNAEVAAGRFKFLWWFVPVNFAYLFVLIVMNDRQVTGRETTLSNLLAWFLTGAILRFVCSAVAALVGAVRGGSCQTTCAGTARS